MRFILFFFKRWFKKKVHFTIDFNEGKIDENTSILYKGIEIGKSIKCKNRRWYISYKSLCLWRIQISSYKNSRFVIEEPTISFDGIKNLGNIIKGNYLSLDYQEGEFLINFRYF